MKEQIGYNEDPKEIRRDIERTRDDVGHTIDEIKERLSPGHMKQTVKDATIGKTKDMLESTAAQARAWGESVSRSMQGHPAWYAVGGAGAGGLLWFLIRRRQKDGEGREYFGAAEESGDLRGRVQETAAAARDRAAQVKSRVSGKVERNPVALGTITFLLGAMAGFMMPDSIKEREWWRKLRETFAMSSRGSQGAYHPEKERTPTQDTSEPYGGEVITCCGVEPGEAVP